MATARDRWPKPPIATPAVGGVVRVWRVCILYCSTPWEVEQYVHPPTTTTPLLTPTTHSLYLFDVEMHFDRDGTRGTRRKRGPIILPPPLATF